MTHQFMQLQKLIFLQKSAVISRDDSPQVVETPCDYQAFPVLPALHKTPTLNTANQYSSADLGNPPHPLSLCKHFVCTFFFFNSDSLQYRNLLHWGFSHPLNGSHKLITIPMTAVLYHVINILESNLSFTHTISLDFLRSTCTYQYCIEGCSLRM